MKLVEKLKSKPKDFTWDKLRKLLINLGYEQASPGRTGGSRHRFDHTTAPSINLHKPHPGNIVKSYVIDDVLEVLEREGLI